MNANMKTDPAAALMVGNVVGIGTRSGRCFTGRIDKLTKRFVTVDLIDWISGGFTYGWTDIPIADVAEVEYSSYVRRDNNGMTGPKVWNSDDLSRWAEDWNQRHDPKSGASE